MKNIVTLLAAATVSLSAVAQSASRPFGLDIAGDVQLAGSDAAAATFQAALPGLQAYLQQVMPEGQRINQGSQLFDPSKLKLTTDTEVRAYFISESTAASHALGFNVVGAGQPRDEKIIFGDTSSGSSRTLSTPLQAGDFVDLGSFQTGQKLDFFMMAEDLGGGNNTNPNGQDHLRSVVSFATMYGSYLVIGFEELIGNTDRDFNDLLFAIDLGSVNLAALTGTPEPATYMTMGLFLVGGVWIARRRQAQKANKA
jgi:Domain of unknown function (DUF4114)